jgi:magnesium-transporting ATPase (P-type)
MAKRARGRVVSAPAASEEAAWHALTVEDAAARVGSSEAGIGDAEAVARLQRFGPNRLPAHAATPRWRILLRQFESPVIYVLLLAAIVALALDHSSDAAFIAAVLGINATLGFFHEVRAEREVQGLARLVRTRARVHRNGRVLDVDAEDVVPGDLLVLESGSRVAADSRLVQATALRIDESLLTGESLPVDKRADPVLPGEAPLAERRNMVFAGSFVASGRGLAIAVATGTATQVGLIASAMAAIPREAPPLLRRMERFARLIGIATAVLVAMLVAVGTLRGESLAEVLLTAVALAVAAIPEGLPIALTVALAVAVSRMARRRVVVRHLPAVEALGSCAVIATDKTGTLTRNELTVEKLVAASGAAFDVSGPGYEPEGEVTCQGASVALPELPELFRLLRAACLANEGSLARRDDGTWEHSGDPTDVAILAAAMKAGLDPVVQRERHPTFSTLPFEPERRYAASFHAGERVLVCVKGAPERVLDMCRHEVAGGAIREVARARALTAVEDLMQRGYRVLAIAEGERRAGQPPGEPENLVFLGLVAMTDPPRAGVPEAIAACRKAGVRVVMVTGDHATTASAIARRIGLATASAPVLQGAEIAALGDDELARRVEGVAVVARATPTDKLRLVRAWQARGELVAVTGDGVNDAPALRQADLGVAMGRSGTDVAREAADLLITDDDFVSIVSGIEEGRVADDNVRKATFLLISTGAGEVLLVTFAIALGHPLPFTAAQLLWLNLVTNGIQDVALVFEPGEPGVLERPPRPAGARLVDRIMLQRTLLAALVFGVIGLLAWSHWLASGLAIDEARNHLVQLFVLFEIFHIGNARSERISLFRLSPLRNRILFLGTLGALAIHLAALHLPLFQQLLGVQWLPLRTWLGLGLAAGSIVGVMELHKLWLRRREAAPPRPGSLA